MSEENKVTYADVVRFYADKDDTDEVAVGAYGKVAKAIHYLHIFPKGISFEEAISELGAQKYIIECSDGIEADFNKAPRREGAYKKDGETYWKTTKEIQKKRYYVHEKYDDYVFAWLFYNRTDWETVKLYNDLRMDSRADKKAKMDFYTWFISRCKPSIKGEYHPGQKWHLFEFILYDEINNIYGFSKAGKITLDVDIRDIKNTLWTNRNFNYVDLWKWMYKNIKNEDIEYDVDKREPLDNIHDEIYKSLGGKSQCVAPTS